MDGMTLLEEARSAGLTVRAEGGRLVIRGPKRAADLAHRLLANKDRIIAALDRPDRPDRPKAEEAPAPTLAWSQAEAEHLLAELQSQVERITREDFADTLPPELEHVLADALAIGEDVPGMLPGLQGHIARCVANWQAMHAAVTPPAGASVYSQDANGGPCHPSCCDKWTWSGADRWYSASEHPPPK
jgi:hypothetical protein